MNTRSAGQGHIQPTALHHAPGRAHFPKLMIAGVLRSGSALGLSFYCLPSIPETVSRHRRRLQRRASLLGFVSLLADWRQQEVQN